MKKFIKKTLCIILAVIMTTAVTVTGFATNADSVLKFDENGDVRAMFFGHEHSNSFTVEINGVDIVNTPSIKPHSILKIINWGSRVITLHEDGTYESEVLTGYELAEDKNSEIIDVGGVSWFEIIFTKIWKAFIKVSLVFWNFATKVFYGF